MRKAKEGFYVQKLGFTASCDVCTKVAPMLEFCHPAGPEEEGGVEGSMIQEFNISDHKVCSFECYKQTKEYAESKKEMAEAQGGKQE